MPDTGVEQMKQAAMSDSFFSFQAFRRETQSNSGKAVTERKPEIGGFEPY
jgi:hypothetical protein